MNRDETTSTLELAERLLFEWNGTARDYPRDHCLHELFEAAVDRHPDAVAVIDGTAEISYRELDRRANRLARHLRRLGVGPEVLVGICIERSAALVEGLLGVLKAGGAYLSLDPSYPRERLAFMLADAGSPVVLTQERLLVEARLEELGSPVFLCLDRDAPGIEAESPERLSGAHAGPGSLGYAIYTSGSTGRPKGVAIEHRSAVVLCHWARETFAAEDLSGMLFSTSINFDLSVFELFVPLAWGGTVIVAENALALPKLPAAGRVTFVNTVPSAMAELVRSGGLPSSVRTVGLAGEPLKSSLVRRIYARDTVRSVYNLYGPSEDTTYSTWARIDRSEEGEPTIGRPVANTELYLLDERGEPVPPGEPGEVYLGGQGLARGYWQRPELTAERFLPDPWSGRPGARLYRVGDLARARPDGRIDFLGRVDHQVKIRGFRIELGEIEAALGRLPGVADEVVTARPAPDGAEQRLVAYVEVQPGHAPTAAGLRAALRERLPGYMVPSAFVLLAGLPRTPNGKVDRKALPEPDWSAAVADEEHVAPRTPVEEALAGIWSSVLGLRRVGVHDRFLELGGHSLLAAQLLSRVRDALGVELNQRQLFERPTVAGLAETVAEARGSEALRPPALEPVPREGSLPASLGQARLWFIDQLQPGSPVYNVAIGARLEGPLDGEALARGFAEIVRRHEALRTVFEGVGGSPVQRIAPRMEAPLPVIDLSALPEDRAGAETERQEAELARLPFDLAAGPLFRTGLLRLEAGRHRLVLCLHHIISDDWSVWVLFRELGALYRAFATGAPSPFPDPPAVQYADFAVWQRRWLRQEGVLETFHAYARRLLAEAPAALDLPADRPRPAVQSFRGRLYRFALPSGLAPALRELARREETTLFAALLAAFEVQLGRYTERESFLVGSPTASRNRTELEGLIGFFTNTMMWRADLSGGPGFRSLLRRVRASVLEGSSYEDLPFEQLPADLQPERDLSYNPFFQVMFALQSVPRPGPELAPGLAIRTWEIDTGTAKLDLSLFLWDGEGLTAAFEYNTDLFDESTVERMAGHYRRLLEAAAADPESPVAELDLLTAAERRQILEEWNDTAAPFPRGTLIHQLFEAQAARAPEAVAVVSGTVRWTYGELNRRANRLAHLLRSRGVGPGALVGVFLERSAEMASTLLGILKAGAAYVPLEAAFPQARLRFILSSLRVPCLVTQESRGERVRELLPELPDLRDVIYAGEPGPAAAFPETDPEPVNGDDELAYIIFTSGSTGTPKGVMVRHRPVINLIDWVNRTFGVGPEDRVLFITALSFDLSVYDLFGLLAAGGSIHVVPDSDLREPDRLVARLREEPVTFWDSAPAALQQLVPFFPAPETGPGSRLRLVFLSGDWIPLTLPDRVRESFPGAHVVSLGGATEATVWSNWFPVGAIDPRWVSIPYGRPIRNARYHVLDARQNPCPAGVAGDLYIGGSCLSSGYVNDPALTAVKYVPDPFSPEPGGRLYRTGDRARYFRDGNLEFLGRLDHQVKIRGFRIELGEIEAVLGEHPGVRVAAVLAREDTPGARRLVAYVVPSREPAPAAAELQLWLRERLPEYMVPPVLVFLDALPATPNGKLDRGALPAPDPGGREEGPAAARNPFEEMIAGLWEQLLGRDRVGTDESFFALGGHSLIATQVIARLREVLKMDIPLRTLFERPTVAGLAAALRTAHRPVRVPPVEPAPREGGLAPVSFAQQRLWFLESLDPGQAVFNLPSLYRLSGRLRLPALGQALTEIVRRHEALRTTLVTRGGTPWQEIAPAAAPALPLADLSALPGELRTAEADRILLGEATRPFDLARGPLARFFALRLGPEEHRLLATFHHAVSDGVSLGVFDRELAALYDAFSAGRPSPLPEPAVQYADYAAWQRRWLAGDLLDSQLAYWRERLAGPIPVLALPSDRPRPEVPGLAGALRRAALPAPLASSLRELSRREGTTLFMTLFAGFLALLHRATGETDLAVGTPVSNRGSAEVEDLVGLFVNTLVIRANASPREGFRRLLAEVRERSLEAYAHQDLPFERLVEELQPERGARQTPFFQLMFSLLRFEGEASRAGEVELRLLDLENGTSQFELTLYMVESEDGLTALVEYRTGLFEESTIDGLLRSYQSILEAAVADPERSLADLPLAAGWPPAAAPAPPRPAPSPALSRETADAAREAKLSELRSRLSDEQRELLSRRLKRRKPGNEPAPSPASSPCLVTLRKEGALPPFFAVHAVGGDVLAFTALARHLGSGRPFYAFQARGLASDAPPLDRIEDMAELYLAEMKGVRPSGPCHLGGWSMGGLVAFEMARRLAERGEAVGPVVLFDTPPPRPRPGEAPPDDAWALAEIVGYAGGLQGEDPGVTEEELRRLPSEERLALVAERLRRAGSLPFAPGVPQLRRLVEVIQANVRAARLYEPPRSEVPLVAFRPEGSVAPDPLGWSRFTSGAVEVVAVPGDHVTLLTEPHAGELAAELARRLASPLSRT